MKKIKIKTINNQIFLSCFISLLAMILVSMFFNTFVLENIYINQKKKEIKSFYEILSKENLTEKELTELSKSSMTKNIRFFVTDKNFNPKYYSLEKNTFLEEKDYIEDIRKFDRNQNPENFQEENLKNEIIKRENLPPIDILQKELDEKNQTIIEETDEYVILKTKDFSTNLNKLELRTKDNENINLIIYTSLDNISETVSIINKISFHILLGGIILGIIMSYLFSKKISRPIKELSKLSKKMSELNFSEKYTLNTDTEIDILGNSFNIMSSKLEETINSLNETNKELEKDIKLLEQVDEKRKEFITNVSHELKTPIAIIQGYGEAIHDGLADSKEDLEEFSGLIISESVKMNKIVLQLIELMKTEEVDPVIEPCNMENIAKNIIATYRNENTNFNLEVSGNMELNTDSFRIDRSLTNYITNAITHLDNDNRIINVSLKEIGNEIEVKVFNYGKQIPEECLEHLWDRFYKVDKARTRKFGGTGIGLSIVKSNIESLDGKVKVENKDDGVEFSFIVPKN